MKITSYRTVITLIKYCRVTLREPSRGGAVFSGRQVVVCYAKLIFDFGMTVRVAANRYTGRKLSF